MASKKNNGKRWAKKGGNGQGRAQQQKQQSHRGECAWLKLNQENAVEQELILCFGRPGLSGSSIATLPPAVLERIFRSLESMLLDDQAAANGNAGPLSTYEDDEPSRDVCEALEAISLTCRAFTAPAQKVLLASIAIDVETQVLADLVKCFTKKADLCTYVSKLTLLASVDSDSPLRSVKGLQPLLQRFDVDTVTVEADPDIGAPWADASTAPFLVQLLECLNFKHLYMRDFECAHTVLLPNKTVQSLTLDFSTIGEGSFAHQNMDDEDDYRYSFGQANKKQNQKKQNPKEKEALSCKVLYIKNLVCAQLHPDPDFGSLRSNADSVDYLEGELDYLEGGREGAMDMASYEEAKMLKELFKQPLGKPTQIHLENCRLSDLALQAIFHSPLLQEVTSLHLHNVVQCATEAEFGEMRPFSLSKLAKLTELSIGAVDKDLFTGCPPGLQELSMLYIKASLGVLQRLLKLESRVNKLGGNGKRRTKSKSKAFPECRVEISANVCDAFADGPVNTISLKRLSSPYVGRYLSLLDVQLCDLGHTDYDHDCIEAAEEAINRELPGSSIKQKAGKVSALLFLWPRYEDEFGDVLSRGRDDSGWKAGKKNYFGDETDYSDSDHDEPGISEKYY